MVRTISQRLTGIIPSYRSEFPLGIVLPLAFGFRESNDPEEYIYLRSQPR